MSLPKGIALVTGASGGIGRAISLKLADEGFDLAINDLFPNKANLSRLADEIQAKGKRVVEVIADVSKEDEVMSMIEKTVAELGGLDVVSFNQDPHQYSFG
jgi:meso-butanediol dehydrogenase / (S,S)-butanediol dehydrogenase / diacetyl reductase